MGSPAGSSNSDVGAANGGGTTSAGGSSSGASSTPGGSATNGGASNNGGASSGGTTSTAGSAPTAGAAGGSTTPPLSTCPAPPAGVPDNAVQALNAVNTIRLAMGVECANLVPALDQSSQAHCDYYAANAGNTTCEGGNISAHDEIMSCTGFTGADPGARINAAQYKGNGWSEVMAFNDDPNKAVTQWVNSVWHRTPLLSPWWDDMGYGNSTNGAATKATKCDVIDQGPGKQMPTTTTAMYPYAGQTGVARSFNGANEGPVPPAPPTGWPSGIPITLYVQKATTVSHSIEVMGSGTPLDHEWIDYKQSDNDSDQLIMYADAPLSANTTYEVNIQVTIGGMPKTFDWTFTTGS
jgi:uncharacterized protein YkwD